jgi:hypothetical protein
LASTFEFARRAQNRGAAELATILAGPPPARSRCPAASRIPRRSRPPTSTRSSRGCCATSRASRSSTRPARASRACAST